MSTPTFSVNQLKTFSKCQKRYEFDYIKKLAWPSSPSNFRLGKGVHGLLDYQAKGFPLDPILKDLDADILLAWKVLQTSRWAQLPTLQSEWGFSLGLPSEPETTWFYGRIDRIAQDTNNLAIIDWKTGTSIPFAPDEDWQTRLYLYAVYEARSELGFPNLQPEQLQFVYIQAKGETLKEVVIAYSQEKHTETAERLRKSILQIQTTQTYALPAACPDKFCPYFSICGILES